MSTLLLVHGGWAASWAWDRLLPELSRRGVAAKAIDLPGHGTNTRRMWSVSLNDYTGAVIEAARQIEGRVIAVGHSMGGFVVTAAAGRAPDAFDELVYLSGFIPIDGERLIQLAGKDEASLLGPGVKPNPLRGCISLDKSVCHDALFHDCSEEDEASATQQLGDNPLRPGITKVKLAEGFAALPKSYILCTEDRALTPEHQKWMANRSHVPIKHEIPTGHMPTLAAPSDLADILASYANSDAG